MNSRNGLETQVQPETSDFEAECPDHGKYMGQSIKVFPESKPVLTRCPKCIEEAREAEAKYAHESAARAQAERKACQIDRACIPARYRGCTLATYSADLQGQKRALNVASKFVAAFPGRGSSLILCGKPGTGKTHLACAIASAVVDSNYSALFVTVLSAIRHIKDTYRRDSGRSETEAVADLLDPSLLVVDEVGAQVGSEHEKLLLFEVINERYQACKPTILISNLTKEELGLYLGDRVMDRFRESGAVVAFDWASYRGKHDSGAVNVDPGLVGAIGTPKRDTRSVASQRKL